MSSESTSGPRRFMAVTWAVLLLVLPGMCRAQTIVGMSAGREPIEAYTVPAQVENAPDVLVIGGLSGDAASAGTTRLGYEAYANERENFLDVTFIPLANPGQEALAFPPPGTAYGDNWTAHSLWRWIASHPPDAVIVMGGDRYGLIGALGDDLMGLGPIPVYELDYENELIAALRGERQLPLSSPHAVLEERAQRSEQDMVALLASTYGQQPVQTLFYIQGMALIGRMRAGQTAAVENLLSPLTEPGREANPTSSLQIAGHLVFAELAEQTGNARYLELAQRVADLGFEADGTLKEAMPFHGDYSDAFFMATPLLAKVGKLTGEQRYFDLALKHVEYLQAQLLRQDGLYNHWPHTDAAWGRGNAFVALGLALALSDFPQSHPGHARLLEIYQAHMRVLLNHVDVDGMWHNVINLPGSWAELSATAMIGTAMQRGVDRGWLEPFFGNVVDQAWQAVLLRTDDEGGFMNVCASTPGQDSLDAYLDREALVGRDDRAGGMMLMFATERLPSR